MDRGVHQIGILQGIMPDGAQAMLPLFAEPSTTRNRYQYFTKVPGLPGGWEPVVVPVLYRGRNCMTSDFGCDILSSGDNVEVMIGLANRPFTVQIYRELY
jgi:hypothetical protein